ncbi:unnamed protein product [Cylicocyclus nassatus]|uniref:GATA-type domain-containing protein n=1 Tax=Cylicocyclus nassatus TaxID=53992 RepID=A0AA36M4M4_CYLNA|nr:unnamed protein product [Cylicocyclus nassatus]
MAPPHGRSYVAVSPPFLPPPITMASVPPLQQLQTIIPRPKPAAHENIECSNCGTKNTSAWRRSADGKSECNACNLFFRKNGRKRPPSMRRDTIARRYRLSRCDLCAIETQNAPQDGTVQLQKPRQRRNGKKNDTQSAQSCSSSDSSVSTQQYFLSHPEFQQPLPNFLATSDGYVHQNSVVMNYNEGTMFNLMNDDDQDGQPSKRSCFDGDNEKSVLPLVRGNSCVTQVFREQKETRMNRTAQKNPMGQSKQQENTLALMREEVFDEHEVTHNLREQQAEQLLHEESYQHYFHKRRLNEGNKLICEMMKKKMVGHYGDSVKGEPRNAKQNHYSNKLKEDTHENGHDELTFHSL